MRIKVVDSIVYEVLLSLSLYKRQTHLKYLGISKNWFIETKEKISEELHNGIEGLEDLQFEDLSVHLIENCPSKDFSGYCSWLAGLSLGALYEMLSPFVNEKRPMPANLEQRKQQHLTLLSMWYEEYFSEIEGELAAVLKAESQQVEETAINGKSFSWIEEITKGFQIEGLGCSEAVLFPSWHFRPLSLIDVFNHKAVLTFPCSMGDKEEALLITKALAEEKRLEMLSHMKSKEKTFTELVGIMGMSKGNIHHHLLLLRSAGLLRIIPTRQDYFLYGFRTSQVEALLSLLLKIG
ncbi:winged helix-turn-helix domain-containing protein [Bacillus sp. REN3]|uniref:winged helix-turn-helix domain-containing protein n=1 Tax=Bacillus sp. REN3 TaxID=2802440 RepID=UPI001AEE9461|nr:winged helix-turn-helix domain-containing protein [Bacillus sp. REN3]